MKKNLEKIKKLKSIFFLSLIFVISSLTVFITFDLIIRRNMSIEVTRIGNSKIIGKYYPGELSAGIMLFHGFGEDQNYMKSFTLEFNRIGYHIFSIDFTGHSQSSGILHLDNTTFIDFKKIITQSKERFKQLSGLNDSEIILLGHSLGANSILSFSIENTNITRGIILVGLIAKHNIAFPKIINDNIISVLSQLNSSNIATNILLISSTFDDIFPPDSSRDIYQRLANQSAIGFQAKMTTIEGYIRELIIFQGIFHTYETFSSRIVSKTLSWSNDVLAIFGKNNTASLVTIKIITYYTFLVGFILFSLTFTLLSKNISFFSSVSPNEKFEHKNIRKEKSEAINTFANIINVKQFFIYKILFWFCGIASNIILVYLFSLIPVGIPIYSLVYTIVINSYGLINFILIAIGKMPGVVGKINFNEELRKKPISKKHFTLFLFGLIIVSSSLVILVQSNFVRVLPSNIRILWVIILTIFSSIGFYQMEIEKSLIEKYNPRKMFYSSINYLIITISILLIFIILIIMGDLFVLFDVLYGVIIFFLILLAGNLIKQFWANRFVIAILETFLLFLLTLGKGPMI